MIMMKTEWDPEEAEDHHQMLVYDNTGWVPDEVVANLQQPPTGTQEGLEFLSFCSNSVSLHEEHAVRQKTRDTIQETRIRNQE